MFIHTYHFTDGTVQEILQNKESINLEYDMVLRETIYREYYNEEIKFKIPARLVKAIIVTKELAAQTPLNPNEELTNESDSH